MDYKGYVQELKGKCDVFLQQVEFMGNENAYTDRLLENIFKAAGRLKDVYYMSDVDLFEKAVDYLSGDMDVVKNRDYLIDNADKVIYIYKNKQDFMDLDFWVRFEQLLGEKVSFEEFLSINEAFDGDPFDIEGPNAPEVQAFRHALSEHRVQRWLGDTESYDYLKQNMSSDALVALANIIEAYVNDRINVEIVRGNNGQIDFDKSFSLVVNDNQYVPCVATGEVEATAIKWYMGFEDTGYVVDVVQDFVDKRLNAPAVDAVLANASERSALTGCIEVGKDAQVKE